MSRPSPRPERLRLPLTLLVCLSAGLAQAAPCDLPEELLDVRVGQGSRGTFVVRLHREADQVTAALLPPDALRPDEQAYVAERLDCDGVSYVRLHPDLHLNYRPDTQTLRVTPAFNRLGQRVIDLRAALTRPAYPVIPAFGVDFGARAAASYQLGGERPAGTEAFTLGAAQAYVGVGGSLRGLTGYVGALASRTPVPSLQLRATAQFSVTPDLTVYAALNATPGVTQPEFTSSTFSGVSVTYRRSAQRLSPRLELQLENPAVITVYVNGTRLGQVEAPAGQVSLLNIPLDQPGRAIITLLIEDDLGVRQQTVDVPAAPGTLQGGGLIASGTAGYSAGLWTASAAAQYALTSSLSVQAQGRGSSDGAFGAGAQVRLVGDGYAASAGVQVSRAAPVTGGARPPVETTLNVSADLLRGPLSAGASVAVPVTSLRDSTLNLRATYNANPWFLSARAGSNVGLDRWVLEAGVTRLLNARSAVTLTAAAQPGGWRAELSGQYRFTPALHGRAALAASPGALAPRATLQYQPGPGQAVTLNATADDLSVQYALSRGVDALAEASTRGAAVQVRGAVTFLNGRPALVAALAQRGVLVRLGVPGIPLTVNGLSGLVTNARGEALITQLPPGTPVLIRVQPRDLPLGVSIGNVELEVLPAAAGLTVVDWQDNFRVSTFVRFRWAPAEVAAGADLYLAGERVPLDDEGYGLVPRSSVARTGELRDAAGARRCAVTVPPGAEDVSCSPGP